MARKLTPAQAATLARLTTEEPGYAYHREAWEGKTLLLGVAYHPRKGSNVSTTLMYRIPQDGKEQGV